MRLSKAINIGAILEHDLNSVGINSLEDLKKCGSFSALLLLNKHYDVCLNKLYALEGAIQGIRWHNLAKEVKDDLKKQYNSLPIDFFN